MAQVPDSAGVQQVEPAATPPADYQDIHATPDSFGGAIARGEEKAGAGITDASTNLFNIADFHDQIAKDYGVNQFSKFREELSYGVPGKPAAGPDGNPVIGPDGKPMPDAGFLGTTNRDASDKIGDALKSLEDFRTQAGKNLSPKQRISYDQETQRMYAMTQAEYGAHAGSQYKVFAGGVNNDAAQQSLTAIARAPDDLEQFKNHTKDLINFRTQEAQIKYGNDPTVLKQVEDEAKAEATSARLQAIAVKEPQRALDLADSFKNTLSVVDKKTGQSFYDALTTQFRARADEQQSIGEGTQAIKRTYQNMPPKALWQPVIDQAAAKYNVSSDYLTRTWQIEASGQFNPKPSSTGAQGPFQFTHGTAEKVGLTNPNNFAASAEAAAKLASENRVALTQSLGRSPTDAELYLAHQQGAAGAAALLRNPTAAAADALAPAFGGDRAKAAHAIAVNGGDPNAPAATFAGMWTTNFNGSAAAINKSRKGAVINDLMAADFSRYGTEAEKVRHGAISYATQQFQSQMIAEEADINSKKLANDEAATGLVKGMLNGMVYTPAQIAATPGLNWETMKSLNDYGTEQHTKDMTGYNDFLGRIVAPYDDPSKITTQTQLIEGVNRGELGEKAFGELSHQLQQIKSDRNAEGELMQRSLGLKYMENILSNNEIYASMGFPKKDLNGERAYNKAAQVYLSGMKDFKGNPADYYSTENVDKFLKAHNYFGRPPSVVAAERIGAGGAEMPSPPPGLNPAGYTAAMKSAPAATSDGTPVSPFGYANVLYDLATKYPTPAGVASFNKRFNRTDGAAIVKQLTGKDVGVPAVPAVVAPAAPAKTYSIKDEKGAGPAGYLGDLLRGVTPQAAQDYISRKGQ